MMQNKSAKDRIVTIKESQIEIDSYTFDVRTSGDEGEVVVLLHGFPETSHMWIPLLEHLGANGYRAIAPDLRGYSRGARPEGAENYSYPAMADDVLGIAEALGSERFHLVGHDHGAGLGWFVVGNHANRIASWSALSVPHIDAFGNAIATNPEQSERSQYILFFQQEGAAEKMLSDNDFAGLKAVWNQSSPEQIEEYLRVFEQPGALTGALNWYRGMTAVGADRQPIGEVTVPTILIWGNQDQAIGRPGVDATPPLMTGPYRLIELDVGHWLIQEAESKVLSEITEHLKGFPV